MHFRAQVGQIPIGDASGGAVHNIGGSQNYAARESRAAKTVLAVTFTVSDRNFSDCFRRDLAQVLASRAHMHPCKHTHKHHSEEGKTACQVGAWVERLGSRVLERG